MESSDFLILGEAALVFVKDSECQWSQGWEVRVLRWCFARQSLTGDPLSLLSIFDSHGSCINTSRFPLHSIIRATALPCAVRSLCVYSLMSAVGLSSHWFRLFLSRGTNAKVLLSMQPVCMKILSIEDAISNLAA